MLGRLFREIPADKIDIFIQEAIDTDIAELHRFRRTDHKFGGVYSRLDSDGRMSRLLRRRIRRKHPEGSGHEMILSMDEGLKDEFGRLLVWFGGELMKTCRLNSLSTAGDGWHHLTESEAFLGVIVMGSDRFHKRTTLRRLLEQTSELFGLLRSGITGRPSSSSAAAAEPVEREVECDELDSQYSEDDTSCYDRMDDRDRDGRLECLHRAFVAWTVATQSQSNLFGTHCFGFISLGIMLNLLLDSS